MTTIVFATAIQLGWSAKPRYKDGELYIDFHRKTLSGVPFSFTAKMGEGKIGNLVKEIESFVDAIDPEICAEEKRSDNPFWQVFLKVNGIKNKLELHTMMEVLPRV